MARQKASQNQSEEVRAVCSENCAGVRVQQFRTETTKGFDGAGSDTRTIFQQFVVSSHGVGVVVTEGRASEVGIGGRVRNNDVQPPSLVGVRAGGAKAGLVRGRSKGLTDSMKALQPDWQAAQASRSRRQ